MDGWVGGWARGGGGQAPQSTGDHVATQRQLAPDLQQRRVLGGGDLKQVPTQMVVEIHHLFEGNRGGPGSLPEESDATAFFSSYANSHTRPPLAP